MKNKIIINLFNKITENLDTFYQDQINYINSDVSQSNCDTVMKRTIQYYYQQYLDGKVDSQSTFEMMINEMQHYNK